MSDTNRFAYFILSNNKTVEVPYIKDLITTTEKCKELYGEVGYLDSVSIEIKQDN